MTRTRLLPRFSASGKASFLATILLAFALSLSCAAADQADIPQQSFALGAFYYPWYGKEQWQQAITHEPQRGLYASRDTALIRAHLEDSRQAGVRFLLYSWWGRNRREDQTLREAFLPAVAGSGVNFAILYETAGALPLRAGQPLDFARHVGKWWTVNWNTTAGDLFVDDIAYLARNYLSHPSYQKIDGRALLYVYLVRDIRNGGEYFARAREICRSMGIELFLVADLVYPAPAANLPWMEIAPHFQAVSAYNMYSQDLRAEEYLPHVKAAFAEYRAEAQKRGLVFLPNVQPGYDDSPLRGRERMTIPRAGGRFYREYWALSEKFLHPRYPVMLLTSFNEWHEGTEIEPSREFGDTYLKLTDELMRQTRERFTPRSPSPNK